MYLEFKKLKKLIYNNSNLQFKKNGSGLNEEITLHPSSTPSHPSFLCLFWIILSIRSEEVLLFLVFLIYIKTRNRMEIDL